MLISRLENKIPPPLIALLFAVAMWVGSLMPPFFKIDNIVFPVLVALVCGLGAFFCISGVISFRIAKTTVNPLVPKSATSLVSSGIYNLSRNPMYVGFALFLVAWGMYLLSLWSLLGAAGFILYMNRFQIIPEERALREIFGSEFIHYTKRVRRWL